MVGLPPFFENFPARFGGSIVNAFCDLGLFAGGTGFAGNLTMLALLTYGGSLVARSEISVGCVSLLFRYSCHLTH